MWLSEAQKFGAAVACAGVLFLLLGVVMVFDAKLMGFGNFLLVGGIVTIIGFRKALAFFTRPQKLKGTVAFACGLGLIASKYTILGFMLEILGILSLFGDFMGLILASLRRMPIIGPILSSAALGPIVDRLMNSRVLPV